MCMCKLPWPLHLPWLRDEARTAKPYHVNSCLVPEHTGSRGLGWTRTWGGGGVDPHSGGQAGHRQQHPLTGSEGRDWTPQEYGRSTLTSATGSPPGRKSSRHRYCTSLHIGNGPSRGLLQAPFPKGRAQMQQDDRKQQLGK